MDIDCLMDSTNDNVYMATTASFATWAERLAPDTFRKGDCVDKFLEDCARFFEISNIKKMQSTLIKAFIDKELLDKYEKTDANLDYKDRVRQAFGRQSTIIQDWEEALAYRKGSDDTDQFVKMIDRLVTKVMGFKGSAEEMKAMLMLHCVDNREVKREVALRKVESTKEIEDIVRSLEKIERPEPVNTVRSYREVVKATTLPRFSGSKTSPRSQEQGNRFSDNRVCWSCQAMGHIRRDCPRKPRQRCFGCGQEGHIRRTCHVVRCNFCHKNGHKEEECFSKKRMHQVRRSSQHNEWANHDRRDRRNNGNAGQQKRFEINGIRDDWNDDNGYGTGYDDVRDKGYGRYGSQDRYDNEGRYDEKGRYDDEKDHPNGQPPQREEIVGAIF